MKVPKSRGHRDIADEESPRVRMEGTATQLDEKPANAEAPAERATRWRISNWGASASGWLVARSHAQFCR